ncbi:16S rRNA (guanine(527)-N(7))-methyltransferase RsmG [Luteimonas vadosa]|uniref:Ribosomal RNA small subunit methyltransferase G n=1 Tax=Luteimonas vadosa TaxID=1165507 RepID=A0ABP9DRY6_9GAMM
MPDTFPSALPEELDAGLHALGLDAALATPLLAYLSLLLRWNRTYNLTAIRDPREMVGKHLLDALSMHPHLTGIASLADLGSGAGIPGIPLAIACPALQVTLVESNGKKARFLREAVRALPLANAQVAESRAEGFDAPGGYDAITARALATLADLVALGGHLLKPAGRLLAMKGAIPHAEIDQLPRGWRVDAVHALHVPGVVADRHLVVVTRDAAAGSGRTGLAPGA